jgi:hypothetical protein
MGDLTPYPVKSSRLIGFEIADDEMNVLEEECLVLLSSCSEAEFSTGLPPRASTCVCSSTQRRRCTFAIRTR